MENGGDKTHTAEIINIDTKSDSEKVILKEYTTFRSIQGLHQQNMRLARALQELAERLEQEEQMRQRQLTEVENETIKRAETVIQELRSRLQTAQLRIDSYVRERDLLRRMLENAGQKVPASLMGDETKEHSGDASQVN
jgi:nucleoprotein TPR